MNSTLKSLTILAAGSVAAVAITGNAQAATFVSPNILLEPPQTTPFPPPIRTASFDKFDSTDKNITAVRTFLDGRLFGSVQFINPDNGGTRVINEYTQRGILTARGPSGIPTIIQVFPTQTLVPVDSPVSLAPGESQGFDFDTTESNGPVSVAQSNWNLFADNGGGSGEIDWSGAASALSSIDNGINVQTTASLVGTFRFEVDYDQDENPPVSPVTTPEPAALLGLFVVGTAGLVNRRRQS